MSSLYKIPFILIFTWSWSMCITAPNGPASQEELLPSCSVLDTTFVRIFAKVTKTLQYAVAVIEISTIILNKYPAIPIARKIQQNSMGIPINKMEVDDFSLSSTTAFGSVMVALAAWMRWTTFRHLGRFFRFEPSIQKNHRLITTGPYSIVRHPSYAASYLMMFPGWFLWNFGSGSWARDSEVLDTLTGRLFWGTVVLCFMLPLMFSGFRRVTMEDDALRKHFGKEWDEWARRVRYRMIPGIW